MSFLALVLKNVARHRVRSMLTVLGIGVGITTVIALGVITAGAKATAGQFVKLGGADFMVAQKGSADLTFSTVSEQVLAQIAARPDVERATGVLMHFTRVGDNPFFGFFGVQRDGAIPDLVAGRRFREAGEVVIGARAAEKLGIGIGDRLTASALSARVTGIYRSDNLPENSGAYIDLAALQRATGKTEIVTVVYVVARGSARELAAAIEAQFAEVTVVTGVGDYGDVDEGMKAIDALNLAISVLAVGIGAIGVMNTMIMSVFERTRELGILRALGWRRWRILQLIVTESVLLCGVATVAGVFLGWLAVQGVMLVPTINSFLEPSYEGAVFVRAIVVAVVVALAGAAYPAVRAVRLRPMEALRHE